MDVSFSKLFRRFGAYGAAVVAVGAALLATLAFPPLQLTPTVLFFAAIVAVAWQAGRGPALLAILLSTLAQDYFIIEPRFSILSGISDVVRFLVFVFVALLVCYLQDNFHRLAVRLQQANDFLDARVQERTTMLAAANDSLKREIQERIQTQTALLESDAKLRITLENMQTTLKEKEVLLRELHHRVKNNLQIIVSLLSMETKSNKDQSSREHLKELQHRVRAIAMLHDRLCKAPDLSHIDIAEYFRELVQILFRSYLTGAGTVRPKITVEQTTLDVDHLIPCALIVNELVCNALKYAYPAGRSGEISVELHRKSQLVELTVGDEGVGLSSNDTFQRSGIGLQIVETLVNQLSGNIEWANGHGTRATITFPDSNR